MVRPCKKINLKESTQAYEQAQQWLKDLEEGYITYSRVFTSSKKVKAAFTRIISGEIIEWNGHIFLWKRRVGEPLILYGQNLDKDHLKNRGLVELCRIRAPVRWIGTGRFRIDWPKEKEESSDTLLLISLYLYSTEVNDLDKLILSDWLRGAYMASLFFDNENAKLFFELADKGMLHWSNILPCRKPIIKQQPIKPHYSCNRKSPTMQTTNLINELRDLEIPVDQLLIETLFCKLNECPTEFTLSVKESFDDSSLITATLYYQWRTTFNDYALVRYFARLSYLIDSENDKRQTFYLTMGNPQITLREASNLLHGRFVNKDLHSVNGAKPYNAWLQLNFYDLDSRGDYKFIHYASRYRYELEHVLRFYPIRGMDDPDYAEELIGFLQRGDLVRVTFVKPCKLEDVYIGANPRTKLINLEYKPSKNRPKNENQYQQAIPSTEGGHIDQ